jgi:hypothetical protein
MNQENVPNALTVFLQTNKKHSDIASTIASIYCLEWIVLLFFHVKGLKRYCHDCIINIMYRLLYNHDVIDY